jgi:uncharacterized protein YbgA (DUF1722 family)
VRFDGGHKRDAFLTETFGRFVEWVPVCPEVECGLGTPRESMPLVRIENAVRLRENLVERVFAYWRLRGLFAARWTVGDLVRFHTADKLLLLAHAPEAYRQIGRLVAGARGMSRRDLERRYIEGFMGGLAQLATARRHTNVLQHMAGYFKDRLDAASKRELADTIADYRRGLVPLVVPLTLLRHYVRMFDVAYLAGQTYLQPHPKELMLRNHV